MADTNHSSWRLPLEICEEVIQFVEDDFSPFEDRPRLNLYSCALVCRDWVPISRICLFRRVELADDGRAISFMDVVVASPGLGVYVQELMVDLDRKHKGWIYQLLQVLPPRLPNLNRLEYKHLPVLHSLFFGLSPRFTTISSLMLWGLEHPSFREIVRLIGGFKNLKRLEVSFGNWVPSESFYVPRKSTSLKVFHLDCTRIESKDITDLICWLTKKQSTSPLEGLHFLCQTLNVQSQYFSELLLQCSFSLKQLKLMWDDLTYNDHFMVDKTWLPIMTLCCNLQNLEIGHLSHEKMLWFLEALHPLLPTSLSTISLCFQDNRDLVFVQESHHFWQAFDNTLTVSRFPKLSSVEITWARYRRTESIEDDLTKLHEEGIFEKVLPTLYRRGILMCGYGRRHVVYPVTEHAQALLARGDWKSWRRLPCHRRAFAMLEEQ